MYLYLLHMSLKVFPTGDICPHLMQVFSDGPFDLPPPILRIIYLRVGSQAEMQDLYSYS